jgi:hypothetical protein
MGDMLPILTGLIVVSALAVVASSDKKDNKEQKEYKEKEPKEPKEKKENKPKEKDDKLDKLFGYFKKNISSKKKPKRYHKVYSKGRTKRDARGRTLYEFRSVTK